MIQDLGSLTTAPVSDCGYEDGDIITATIDINKKKVFFSRKTTYGDSPLEIHRIDIGDSPYTNPKYAIGTNLFSSVNVIVENVRYSRS